jgi:hypothetical protein
MSKSIILVLLGVVALIINDIGFSEKNEYLVVIGGFYFAILFSVILTGK